MYLAVRKVEPLKTSICDLDPETLYMNSVHIE